MYRALSPVPNKPIQTIPISLLFIQTNPSVKVGQLTYHKIDIISPVLFQIIESVVCK